jgi:FlgD Ig-like domain
MKKFQLLPLLVLLLPFVLLYANWEPLDEVPADVGAGGAVTYGGQYIWCIVGGDDASFYAYDIRNSEWIEDLDDVPEDIDGSAAIAYESGVNKRIFVAYGDHLWIYTRDGNGTDGAWNEENPIDLPYTCGPGVSMAYQPVVEKNILIGGYLYILFGDDQTVFRRCFIADTLIHPEDGPFDWQELDDFPVGAKAGAALCFNHYDYGENESESLFALVGDGQNTFCSYKIGSNVWIDTEPQTLLPQNNGSSICSGVQGRNLYAIFGESENPEQDHIYRLRYRDWYPRHGIPVILGPGASITCDAAEDNLYLVIGDDRDGFYIDEHPFAETTGPGGRNGQSQSTFTISSSSKTITSTDKVAIYYSTNEANRVKIQIFDLTGNKVKSLFYGKIEKGDHQIIWNKTDNSNCKVASGIYFVTIEQGNKPERLKVIIR